MIGHSSESEFGVPRPVDLKSGALKAASSDSGFYFPLVRTLVAGDLPAGRHEERWDGFDDAGQRVSSGIYMARLRTARGEVDLLKLTLVK